MANTSPFRYWLLLMMAVCLAPLRAEESLSLEFSSGNEVTVEQIGEGADRLLWLPSEFGFFGETERQLARQFAEQGFSVWLVDLQANYFVPPGRRSLDKIPRADVRELIDAAQPNEGKLYLFSYGRGAALLLEAAREWQLHKSAARPPLGGALLLHPNLMAGTARAGAVPQFLPIASATNLPLFILQPMNSAKRWYMAEVIARLEQGGSDLFTRRLAGVSDGFQVRDDARPYELEVRKKLPAMLASAARLLGDYNLQPRQPVREVVEPEKPAELSVAGSLRPMKERPTAPSLSLTTIDGDLLDLHSMRGEIVLVNFWATWCPPCVEEIPSLGRLNKRLADHPFRVISVDVGETEQQVRQFLSEVPAAFPVMLDPDGSSIEPWKIRAFPTSFIVDQEGRLRYGYFGGLEWDDDEVVALIRQLIDEQ